MRLGGATLYSVVPRVRVRGTVKQRERANLNSALLSVSLFFLNLSHRPGPTRLSPASCLFQRQARAESPSSRHSRRSSLRGASMRCHKFWGPCSIGFYILIAVLFKGRFWVKLRFPSRLFSESEEEWGAGALRKILIGKRVVDNLDPSLRPQRLKCFISI